MDRPTKDGHRTGKKRSKKELETVQTTRKKVVPESRKIRPRQRRGFFISSFPDMQSRILGFPVSILTMLSPHQPRASGAGRVRTRAELYGDDFR
jgi:hypothetical protein